MGPGRSLRALLREYDKSEGKLAPTCSFGTLSNWSVKYGWQERAVLYDARLEAEKNEHARRIMQTGLAVPHVRTQSLKSLAALLVGQLYEKGEDDVLHNLWIPDVKQVGSGDSAERVDIERYNSALISDIRGVLDDLAKETGGRAQRQLTGNLNLDLSQLSDEQLERLARGDDPLTVLMRGKV